MAKKKRPGTNQPTPAPSRPSVPEVLPARVATENAIVAPAPARISSPAIEPAVPQYECSVSVFADKVTVTPRVGADAEIKTGGIGGFRTISVTPKKAEQLPFFVSFVPKRAFQTAARTWFGKWLDRLGAGILWAVSFSYLFLDQGLVGRVLAAVGVASYWEPIALLGALAFLLIWLARRGTTGALLASLYIAFFPIVAFFIIAARVFGVVMLFRRATSVMGSFAYRGANWLLIVVSCAAIAKSQNGIVIAVASTYLVVGTLYLIGSNFLWVTRPLRTVFAILGWLDDQSKVRLQKFKSEFSSSFETYKRAVATKNEAAIEAAQKKVVEHLGAVKGWVTIATTVRGKLRKVVAPVVLFYLFAGRFLASLLLLIVVFASLYVGIAKLNGLAFGGKGIHGMWDGIYFSTLSFFTASYGDIIPVDWFAKGIVLAQVITGLMMLTLLALSFSTLSAQTTSVTADEMEKRAKEFLDELTKEVAKHFKVDMREPVSETLVEELKKDPRNRLR